MIYRLEEEGALRRPIILNSAPGKIAGMPLLRVGMFFPPYHYCAYPILLSSLNKDDHNKEKEEDA
jgi:hypothetical protein